jgi:hypothetical protein
MPKRRKSSEHKIKKEKSSAKRRQSYREKYKYDEAAKNLDEILKFGNRPLLISPHGPAGQWIVEQEISASSSGEPPASRFGSGGRRNTKPRKKVFRVPVAYFGQSVNKDGEETITIKGVTPSMYLSFWDGGQPRMPPPSWNPLLLQGRNNFPVEPNYPTLSDVI